MKKLALIGAASALALAWGTAMAQEYRGGSDPSLSVETDDVQAALAGQTAVAIDDTLNGNSLFSDNESNVLSHNYTSVFAPEYKDESSSLSVSVGDVQVNANVLSQTAPGGVANLGAFGFPTVASSGGPDGHGGGDEGFTWSPTYSFKTGDIAGSSLSGNGIIAQNNNTGSANQFNAISVNAKITNR